MGSIGGNGEGTNSIANKVLPETFQTLWKKCNLRGAVLMSLTCQIILIFCAPLRKRSGSMIMQGVLWATYLLADWIAAIAVGLTSSNQECEKKTAGVNKSLAAFWAPFLLHHLGGPDTITAYSLEDNELWVRHLLALVVQVFAVVYVLLQSLPKDELWIPTVLMICAGTIKYAERVRALYLACLSSLKDSLSRNLDLRPNYARFTDVYSANQAANVPSEIHIVAERKTGLEQELEQEQEDSQKRPPKPVKEIIQRAYWFYDIFRGLIVDHMFSIHERNKSRNYFFTLNPKDAFKIMEVELNFMYDALYTKMATVHHGFFGYIMRFICSALLVAVFVIFSSQSHHRDGDGVHPFDIAVTYALLVGAVILDFVSFIKLLFSDWTVALIEHSTTLSALAIQPLLKMLNVTSGILAVKRIILFRKRWCERLYYSNLISYCLTKRYAFLDKTAELFAVKDIFDKFWYREQSKLDESLKEFIFNILEKKAKEVHAKSMYSSRGECTLLHYDDCPPSVEESVSENVEYDESVLKWHIATDICFHCFDPKRINASEYSNYEYRELSKQLSDYLLYLLIMQPKLMLSVAGMANIRFRDTCVDATKFFRRSRYTTPREAREKLLDDNPDVKLIISAEYDRSMSLLYDAVMLAKDLRKMMEKEPLKAWEMTSKIWLELLCYGASHCRGDAHAQQLRQGGELITFVWLLMVHFGMGKQFRTESGHAGAKLIVYK